jgi:asparagine synthase (glutamine-hydrolysing)
MCGIVAAIPSNQRFLEYAMRVQKHRGPDDEASVDLGFCNLGVNRLAISGIQDGPQPLKSTDGEVVVIFNGAIYNFVDLCKEHEFTPPSRNDGEIIWFLYQKYGIRFADYLEGMYAIVIADQRNCKLVFAVDQIGIKPLYWCHQVDSLLIASIISAFPETMRQSVRRVPTGIVWDSTGGATRICHRTGRIGSLGQLLEESVVQQIPQEVKWGCALSGGVDSSLITAIAAKAVKDVKTFTCGMKGSTDLVAAANVAKRLGTEHHEIVIDESELVSIVDNVIAATESFEPWTVSAGVGSYITAREAKRNNVKVLLTGEGADELFGGYDEFQDVPSVLLNARLLQYQADLGVSECLRLDRATMAHGVEARVPYLSTSIIRHARSLSPGQKIIVINEQHIRKFALREYAKTILPIDVAMRSKEEFANGSGLTVTLKNLAESFCPRSNVIFLRSAFPTFPIVDSLSGWYFSRWLKIFGMTIGLDWPSMVERGLFRQTTTDYLMNAMESAVYIKH